MSDYLPEWVTTGFWIFLTIAVLTVIGRDRMKELAKHEEYWELNREIAPKEDYFYFETLKFQAYIKELLTVAIVLLLYIAYCLS